MSLLQRALAAMTCAFCAGAGLVTTQVNKVSAGVLFRDQAVRRECPRCGGTGVEPGFEIKGSDVP